jgi:hypothetical protein
MRQILKTNSVLAIFWVLNPLKQKEKEKKLRIIIVRRRGKEASISTG